MGISREPRSGYVLTILAVAGTKSVLRGEALESGRYSAGVLRQ